MLELRGDLHIHSVLSPCASLEMGPLLIVQMAKERGLNLLAITDHNSTKNLNAFDVVCKENNIHLLYGIEVETKEEIHVLCYFDDLNKAEEFGELIYTSLMNIDNDPELFGYQVIVDENENILNYEHRLLLQRSNLGLTEIFYRVQKLGGFLIPAHIDRAKSGLLITLGFLPIDIDLPILEISKSCNLSALKKKYNLTKNTIFKGCDAHTLEEIGKNPLTFYVKEFSLKELLLAFKGEGERKWFQQNVEQEVKV